MAWAVQRVLIPPPPIAVSNAAPSASPPKRVMQYKTYPQAHSIVHTLKIPLDGQFVVVPALSKTVETVEAIAQRQNAIAALNGGFFDPENQKSTAYVTLNGKLVADPQQNESLMSNPDLTPYLSKILNRTEFRQYQCGNRREYAIALHSDAVPAGCQLVNALGGGPRLLPTMTAQPEGFVAEANGNMIRDALGSRQPNARTAIGVTRDRSLLWVMVAQKPGVAGSGMTLPALAAFLKTLDVEEAMNLDGGSSSSLYYDGKTVYGKLDSAGKPVMRPVKSVLLVKRV
ncbi:MAG: phosphodiester glycosidase family protein [Stenomitos rutilans HA7619-LM2]|nr:phosphodiester glycosidase family protein [Stenomitos rutilans HA7619-LM2]